jgi:hypothetical protein
MVTVGHDERGLSPTTSSRQVPYGSAIVVRPSEPVSPLKRRVSVPAGQLAVPVWTARICSFGVGVRLLPRCTCTVWPTMGTLPVVVALGATVRAAPRLPPLPVYSGSASAQPPAQAW